MNAQKVDTSQQKSWEVLSLNRNKKFFFFFKKHCLFNRLLTIFTFLVSLRHIEHVLLERNLEFIKSLEVHYMFLWMKMYYLRTGLSTALFLVKKKKNVEISNHRDQQKWIFFFLNFYSKVLTLVSFVWYPVCRFEMACYLAPLWMFPLNYFLCLNSWREVLRER